GRQNGGSVNGDRDFVHSVRPLGVRGGVDGSKWRGGAPGSPARAPDGETFFSLAQEALARLRGARVLVVEDDLPSAQRLSRLLTSFGCEVIGPAYGPVEARRLAVRRPAAAVLDVGLGVAPAFDLAQDLTARGIAVLLVTAEPREQMPPRLRGYPLLSKPFTPSALAGVLMSAIA